MEINDLKTLRSDVLTYRHIFDRVDALRDELERITAKYGDEPRGQSGGDKMSGMVAQIVDLLNSLSGRLILIEKKRYEAEQAIQLLPAQQGTVLYLRYIEGMSWEKIAKETHYNRQYLMKIHRCAVENLKR